MKIALVQQHASADKADNLARGLQSFEQAAKGGAELVCFAELAFERFHPQRVASGDVRALAETIPGPITDAFSALARRHGVVAVLNLVERDGSRTYDSSPVIDADGRLLGTTRMLHITDYPCFHEQGYYTPGDRGTPVYETAAGRIGVAICYDRHYPEVMRALALGGADLVVIPQAGSVGEWPEGLYEGEMRVAAFQNGYFVALCNRVGEEECLEFAGESFVCGPDGIVVARAAQGRDEILYADIDLAACRESHARRLFLRHRRSELYAEWFTQTAAARGVWRPAAEAPGLRDAEIAKPSLRPIEEAR
jgi:predicted amidohydrolase